MSFSASFKNFAFFDVNLTLDIRIFNSEQFFITNHITNNIPNNIQFTYKITNNIKNYIKKLQITCKIANKIQIINEII